MKVEIKHKEAVEQDIFTPGNVVCVKDNKEYIVMVTSGEPDNANMFCGVVINSPFDGTGTYSAGWIKESFKQFHGTITLEQ